MLSVVVTNLDGTQVLLPRTDWKFRIAGENPDPEICKAFLQSLNPTLWWTYAVAKHESKGAGGRPYYNQFLDDGASHDVKGRSLRRRGLEGRPAWRDDGMPLNNLGTGGYGLFQLASDVTDPEFIMPRGWIWNWQENARQAVKQLGTAVIGNEVHPGAVKYLAIQRSRAFSGTAPVPVPRLSVSRTPTPHLGEPASQPLVMLGGDAAFGFPSMVNFIPKITFFDPTLRPADKGELFEVAESIHQFDAGLGSHYVQWTPAGWKFNRGRGRDLRSYVDLVAVEIDAEDLHTVAP
jgi:hypothetical protein